MKQYKVVVKLADLQKHRQSFQRDYYNGRSNRLNQTRAFFGAARNIAMGTRRG